MVAAPETDPAALAELMVEHARFDELDELRTAMLRYGVELLASARDSQGNSCAHMAAANGHEAVMQFLVDSIPLAQLTPTNAAGSTPLHWAVVNAQLEILRIIAPIVDDAVLMQPDGSGATPLDLADAHSAYECAGYLMGVRHLRERDRAAASDDPGTTRRRAAELDELMKGTMLDDVEVEVVEDEGDVAMDEGEATTPTAEAPAPVSRSRDEPER